MRNLAGDKGCDPVIRRELAEAIVQIVEHGKRLDSQVPASVTGQLTLNGESVFAFRRAWYYWTVSGNVPLAVAQEMYADPVGREDVRVAGHCGCPPPEKWAYSGFVESYHIDSQRGLNLFAATMRKHGLAD